MKHILRSLLILTCCMFLLNACALAQTDAGALVPPETTAVPSPTPAPEAAHTATPVPEP